MAFGLEIYKLNSILVCILLKSIEKKIEVEGFNSLNPFILRSTGPCWILTAVSSSKTLV